MGVVMVPLLAQGTLTKEFHILVNKGLKKNHRTVVIISLTHYSLFGYVWQSV